jgi:hypothetical protein
VVGRESCLEEALYGLLHGVEVGEHRDHGMVVGANCADVDGRRVKAENM